MSRSALPQNYLLNQGTQIENFETLGNWTVTTDNDGTAVIDTTNFKTGSQSIKLSVTNAAGVAKTVTIKKTTFSFKILPKYITLWVYLYTPQVTFGQLSVYIGATSGLSSHYRLNYPLNAPLGSQILTLTGGWNRVVMHRDDLTIVGTPSWNNTQITIQIRLAVASVATNQVCQIAMDDLRYDGESLARCVINCDGGRYAVYRDMYPYMAARGIKGTAAITVNNVGGVCGGESGRYMTLSEFQALYAAGWSVINHTVSHPDLTTLTQAQIETEINGCAAYLLANGFPKTAYYFAYPNGAYNDTVLAAVDACGVLTARTTYRSLQNSGGDMRTIKCYVLSNGQNGTVNVTLEKAKETVDWAIRYGATVFFYIDGVYTSTPYDAYEQPISTWFQPFIDYIAASKIKCVTMDEWYKGLTDPKYQSISLSRQTAGTRTTAGIRVPV
jgi:peptidoglycan/xylan/chitin deacetylase (PgdA/CDA1 family)